MASPTPKENESRTNYWPHVCGKVISHSTEGEEGAEYRNKGSYRDISN